MRHYLLLGLCLIATLLYGCSSFSTVYSETYNKPALEDTHTFRIVDPSMGHLPNGMSMSVYNNITNAIRKEMIARGYTESSTSKLLVNFAVTIHREIESAPPVPTSGQQSDTSETAGPYCNRTYPYFIYPRSNYWSATYAIQPVEGGIYKVGVLTVDIIDTATMTPLYTASASNVMNSMATRYRRPKNIAKAVAKIFSEFPIPATPKHSDKN